MEELSWGRRYLMCPPTHYEVAYAINPWMHGVVDRDLAMVQWLDLTEALRRAGAEVEVVEAVPDLPDMVFTANAGLVDGATFIAGRMRWPERAGETDRFAAWAAAHDLAVAHLPDGAVLEGLGDCLPLGEVLVAGHGQRSTTSAHAFVSGWTGREVVGVELADPRWYHVDLTLCPLDRRRAIVFPDAYDAAGARAVMAQIPEPLVLDADQAATFAANSAVVGRTVVMPACPPPVGRALEAWGFDVVVVDVGEFTKAGGAVRCLTLPLDTRLTRAVAAGPALVEDVA
ncbi:dimethylarginine dimethylaminohydrolase family protein [Euzebya sp.]|uniref:dimethylarginine dimethylaminohydrolase family protein n=1 Tax=Euzebya sp. TaxID=1971409 RepID=UPI0035168AAA